MSRAGRRSSRRCARGRFPRGHRPLLRPESRHSVGLAGELVRLGCDRLEYRPWRRPSAARERAPYSVLRAIGRHRDEGLRRHAAGQTAVWLAAGLRASVSVLRPRKDSLVLIGADSRTIPDREFLQTSMRSSTSGPRARSGEAHQRRMPLGPGSRCGSPMPPTLDAPSLWVVRDDAATKIERLVAASEGTTRR